MTVQTLTDVLDGLWNNWAFRLSLSSNELFHSNVLQFISESLSTSESGSDFAAADVAVDGPITDSSSIDGYLISQAMALVGSKTIDPGVITVDAALQLLELLAGSNSEAHSKFQPTFEKLNAMPLNRRLFVAREAQNLDLAVFDREDSEKRDKFGELQTGRLRALFALEVKVKAFPEKEQLKRYLGLLARSWSKTCEYQPPLFLLTGMGAQEATAGGTLPVTTLNFATLQSRLEKHNFDVYRYPVQVQYTKLCALLHKLFEELQHELNTSSTLQQAITLGDTLSPYRVHSIWWKQWAAFLVNNCADGLPEHSHFYKYSGFTRTGNLGVCWRWANAEIKADKSIQLGVQIEGRSLLLFLNIVHEKLGPKKDARSNTEKIFLKLIAQHGVFANNPHINALRLSWATSEQRRTNGRSLAQFRAPPISMEDAFCIFDVDESRGKTLPRSDSFSPLLPGYANAAFNGHSDIRLAIKPTTTIGQIADAVRQIVVCGAYSEPSVRGEDSPLLRAVKEFEADPDKWVAKMLAD